MYKPFRSNTGHCCAVHSNKFKSTLAIFDDALLKVSMGTIEPASCHAGPRHPGSRNRYPLGANSSQLGMEPNLVSNTSKINRKINFQQLPLCDILHSNLCRKSKLRSNIYHQLHHLILLFCTGPDFLNRSFLSMQQQMRAAYMNLTSDREASSTATFNRFFNSFLSFCKYKCAYQN